MKTLNLVQGTPAWHAHRAMHHNSSDAAAMLGVSPYKTRSELVRECATGIPMPISAVMQRLFDDGHRFEALARPLAEKIIGEDLYPCVGTAGKLSASFDGMTMSGDIVFEHKTLNDDIRQVLADAPALGNKLPEYFRAQMEQQSLISGVDRVLFMASVWTDANEFINEIHCWYEPDVALRARIVAGWAQFEIDVANYKPEPEAAPAAIGRTPMMLPALRIELVGQVTASNLKDFRDNAIEVFKGIRTDLQTDQDFADAEQTVKWCGDIEDRLDAAKQHALSQTASIDELFRAIDAIKNEARTKRLELDKLVKARKESIRIEIITKARAAYQQHEDQCRQDTGGPWLVLSAPDFVGAIKGKRSISSMHDAIDTALANAKIAASESARKIREALACLDSEAERYEHLFADRLSFITKPVDDIRTVARARIVEHKTREAARLESERERIRKEEADRIQREHDEKVSKGDEARAAAEPVVQNVPPAHAASPRRAGAAPTPARISLSEIHTRIAPLSIGADGLATLGFKPVGTRNGQKLYNAVDFSAMCDRMSKILTGAAQRIAA